MRQPFPTPEPQERLPDLGLDLAAAAAVMNCEAAGIRAYAQAGGLDPAKDFRGMDLSGVPLAGQCLSGFDFSRCDLRGTGIERAIVDSTFVYDGAILDPGVVPGSDPEIGEFSGDALRQIQEWINGLHSREHWTALAAFGAALLPIIESKTSLDDETTEICDGMALSAAWGEWGSDAPAKALTRAERLLKRREGRADPTTLLIRNLRGRSLQNLRRCREALDEFDGLLPFDIEVRGPRDLNTLATRSQRALALRELGRYRESFDEFESLLPLIIEICGSRDPDTLATRHQRALVLQDLGRYREALDDFNHLLPLEIEVEGPRHLLTLATRHQRASVLRDLGRYREAFEESDALVALLAHVKGSTHECTIIAGRLRAWLSYKVGCVDDALSELAELIQLWDIDIERAATRSLRCGILIAARRDFAQVDELRDIVATLTWGRGPSHLQTLRARYRLARAQLGSGKRDAARAEIAATIADYDPATDPGENYLSASRRLLATIDGLDGGEILPE